MGKRIFGELPGVHEGAEFPSRKELHAAGVHLPTQAGISGSASEGADSIVLSGGYEDDHDEGDVIVYTGHGGRDQQTGKQVTDQTLTQGNRALALNHLQGLPVRVIRGHQHRSPFSPRVGYQYGGLYRVDDLWHEQGKSGFVIWRFRLVKLEAERATGETVDALGPTARQQVTVQRLVRDTAKARAVKVLHEYTCQMCGVRLEGPGGPYAEAAHIRPLGSPHDGPDVMSNILCLCPNHHVLFDLGSVSIADDFSLLGMRRVLRQHPKHEVEVEYVQYHRERYFPLSVANIPTALPS